MRGWAQADPSTHPGGRRAGRVARGGSFPLCLGDCLKVGPPLASAFGSAARVRAEMRLVGLVAGGEGPGPRQHTRCLRPHMAGRRQSC